MSDDLWKHKETPVIIHESHNFTFHELLFYVPLYFYASSWFCHKIHLSSTLLELGPSTARAQPELLWSRSGAAPEQLNLFYIEN